MNASASSAAIDQADLLSALLSLRQPSRAVDEVVDFMLAGKQVSSVATAHQLACGKWLADETPPYTSGGAALSALARRRGCRVITEPLRGGYRAVAKLPSGESASAVAPVEGAAGLAAVIRLLSSGKA